MVVIVVVGVIVVLSVLKNDSSIRRPMDEVDGRLAPSATKNDSLRSAAIILHRQERQTHADTRPAAPSVFAAHAGGSSLNSYHPPTLRR